MINKITKSITQIAINDHCVDLFEGQYVVPNGISYNSYVVFDKKIALLDTCDANFLKEWTGEVESVLDGKEPDYFIVTHMEPDHSAAIAEFMNRHKKTVIVGNDKTFNMLFNYFGQNYENRREVVKDGDTLCLGEHNLTFVFAPMVHWPEVMLCYDDKDKALFSADAFGKFGALDKKEPWENEARRYYIGIVGKYGLPVQSVLKKAASLDIACICPLHGPVLNKDLGRYIGLYDKWSKYEPEKNGTVIAYTSVYGHTKKAALELEKTLKAAGEDVKIFDAARCDASEAIASAFEYSKLVIATTTYNGEYFPAMRHFVAGLKERNFQNRKLGIIENGSWAPMAAKLIKSEFENSKAVTFFEPVVTIKSALNAESEKALRALCEAIIKG